MEATEDRKFQHGHIKSGTDFIQTVPQWFIGIAGLLYLTGFLIVSAHLGRLGIREPGFDFLRLRYIEVGIIYVLPYLVILIPVLIWFRLSTIRKNKLIEEHRSGRYAGTEQRRCTDCTIFMRNNKKVSVGTERIPDHCQTCVKAFRSQNMHNLIRVTMTGPIFVTYLAIFTLVLYFSPHNYVREESRTILALGVVTVVGLIIIAKYDSRTKQCPNYQFIS